MSEKVKLTGKEKSELWIEGIVTVILLLMLNFALLVLINQMIAHNPGLENAIWGVKTNLTFGRGGFHLWSWSNLFLTLMGIADVIVVYWRLARRYRQMQMRHVIAELHYIADGHLDHRIKFEVNTELQKVVSSINALVDSTVNSMEEERRIEQSKDELITNVSHDIRTPLTSIIGYLGLIEDHQYRSEAELLKYTHTAYLKAKQMKVLVEDLFEYTKVKSTTTKLNPVRFNMIAMLEQLAASFELEAHKKHMRILVSGEPNPLMMEADTEKLGRVFNNLIVSQLFDRFYRVEESRSQETGGTGLGLAIAQSIIALHGGYIYADSSPELTSFVIHLPLKVGASLTDKQTKSNEEAGKTK